MFYNTQGIRTILQIHPSDMGMLMSHNGDKLNKNELLKKELFQKVEGKQSTDYGYIIEVVNIRYMSKPIIDYDGFVKVELQFDAITFKPILNEYIDIIVKEISQEHINGHIGPISNFYVPFQNLPTKLLEMEEQEEILKSHKTLDSVFKSEQSALKEQFAKSMITA